MAEAGPSGTPGVDARRTTTPEAEEREKDAKSDVFDGTGNYRAWRKKMRVTAIMEGWSDIQAMRYTFRRVTGAANAILLADLGDNDDEFPWTNQIQVLAQLDPVYGGSSLSGVVEAARKLKLLRQDGTLDTYIKEFAQASADAGIGGATAASMFVTGLKPNLALACATHQFGNLSHAIQAARAAEPAAERASKAAGRTSNGSRGRGGWKAAGRTAQTEDLSKVECYFCGNKGHMKKDCNKYRASQAGGRGGGTGRGQGTGTRGGRQAQLQLEAPPNLNDNEYHFNGYIEGNE